MLPLLLTILVSVPSRSLTRNSQTPPRAVLLITGGVCALLIPSGFVFAIVAHCAIPQHGRKGLLGRGIAGLTSNSLILLLSVAGLVGVMKRGLKAQQANEEIHHAVQDVQTSLRESYDPEQVITNLVSKHAGAGGGRTKPTMSSHLRVMRPTPPMVGSSKRLTAPRQSKSNPPSRLSMLL